MREGNRLERLLQVARKPRRTVIGLMSGTSVDGIDAALVEIEGQERGATVRQLAFATYPFPASLRQRVFALFDPDTARIDEICRLDFLLGELFAAAALKLLRDNGRGPEDIDLLGTAGQTVWHAPEPVVAEVATPWAGEILMTRSTLAIGQAAVIAERTGILTLGDLRVRDVAAGGQGAPLVSYADWALLTDDRIGRCVQNIGGIGNVTYLPPGARRADVFAFDTGPGNMVIDAVTDALTGGRLQYDHDGVLAASGTVRQDLLDGWLTEPYYALPPPKTTGRELFGVPFVRRVLAEGEGLPAEDVIATVTALTAESIARSYRRFVAPRGVVDEVIVGGGGAKNATLLGMLRERLPDLTVVTHEERGIDSRAKEALAIAIIASDSLHGCDTNLFGATGGRPTSLGKLSL